MSEEPHNNVIHLNLDLTREFLVETFAEPILSVHDKYYGDLYTSVITEAITLPTFTFGGIMGNQYETVEQLENFLNSYDELIKEFKIDAKFKDELLFFPYFFFERNEEDSLINHSKNRLRDIAKVIEKLAKVKLTELRSEDDRLILIKQGQSYEDDEILKADDEFLRNNPDHNIPKQLLYKTIGAKVGNLKLLLPIDTKIKIVVNGEDIVLPNYLNGFLLQSLVDIIYNEHKHANSSLFKELEKEVVNLEVLEKYAARKTKKAIGINNLKYRVAVLLTNYLKNSKRYYNWSAYQLNDFIFRYFCILGVFKSQNEKDYFGYKETIKFYKMQGKSGDSIRVILQQTDIQYS